MENKLEPKTLKGFKDYFAEDVIVREYIRDSFKNIAQKYGYEPLETPALEYAEFVLGQSGKEAEKLYYRFKDQGDRDVMLKYELMISMCRAVSQNFNNLPIPYKRYQIQNVWRADNVQRGRLREFTQMDIDTIGSSSLICDAEVLEIGLRFMKNLGFEKYIARISSRKILGGVLQALDIPTELFEGFYISVDKIKKIGEEGVRNELVELRGIPADKVDQIMEILRIKDIEELNKVIGKTESGSKGIEEDRQILKILSNTDLSKDNYTFDITLARGLASYTGPVWEFEVVDDNIGSLGGGGRYDKAISKYIGKEVPATGTSFGLERLQQIIKDRNMLNIDLTSIKVLVINIDEKYLDYSMNIAKSLRDNNINTMMYPDSQKLGNIFKYADKKNIPWVIVIGENEVNANSIQLKNMSNKEQFRLTVEEGIKKILKK